MSEAYQGYNPSISGQSGYGQTGGAPSLEAAAANFRSKVEEASNRLSGAAEQFVAMSDGLMAAVEQARQAAEKAEAAQRNVESLQAEMAQNYGNVNDLVRELQQRIAALAVLAQPMGGATAGGEASAQEAPTQLHGESQSETTREFSPGESENPFGTPGESSW